MNGTPSDGESRVVRFRPRRAAPAPDRGDGLAGFARTPPDPGEYRHRMAVNAAAFVVVALLVGVALWLADSIADMRRNQDCVLSGRHGCTPVEYDRTVR